MDDTRQLTADLESSWKYVRRSAENVKKAPPDAVHTVARNVAHSYSVEQAGVTDLDRQTQIGLAVDWWVNPPPNSRVMFALDKSFLDHWASVVDDCLRRRRNARMQPTTWSELEQLLVGRNQTSENRRQFPVTGPMPSVLSNTVGLMHVAAVLEVEPVELLPTHWQWLRGAVVEMTLVAHDEAAAYVHYRLAAGRDEGASPPVQNPITAELLSRCGPRFASRDECWEAVVSTARAMGEFLLESEGGYGVD